MATEDRDRKFEKALAKELRSKAVQDSFSQNAACPDAEILAAYHERSLSLEELNSWKSHIAGCAECQEILAQLEITDEIPAGVEKKEPEKESVVGVSGRGARLASEELMMAAGPAPLRAAASLPEPKRDEVKILHLRKTPWRWIAPAGAIAAVLLVWVALQERAKLVPPQSPGVQVAANHELAPTTSTQPAAPSALAGASAPTDEKKKASSPHLPASSKADLAPGAFSTPPPHQPAKNQIAPPPPEPPVLTADAMSADRAADHDAVAGVGGMLKQKAGPKPPAPASATRASGALAYSSVAGAKPAAPAPEAAPADSERAGDKGVSATSEAVEVAAAAAPTETARNMVSSKSMMLRAQELPRIMAPNGYAMWVVGPSGLIERSEDAGKTWKLQKSGVKTNLRAGAAPSESICWVVGSDGVILRTTDGGNNWSRITSPVDGDLGAVEASSELRAMVTEAGGKRRYATLDGGLNWTALSTE